MKKAAAERYRDIDFSRAKRGAVVKPEPGKTKISPFAWTRPYWSISGIRWTRLGMRTTRR